MDNSVQYPDMMNGKKILYIHGFASSGSTGTAKNLRILLPNTEVISPDLPLHPHEAMKLIRDICDTEKPDIIIGTSMGAMYTELMKGYKRICVNPSFHMAKMLTFKHLGKNFSEL